MPIICERAFYDISAIDECAIKSKSTRIETSIFRAILISADDEKYYNSTVKALDLVGNNFSITSAALSGISIPYLSIDLSGTYISGWAFLSSSIDTLNFVNTPSILSDAIANGCFASCDSILQLGFDVEMSTLTSQGMLDVDEAKLIELPAGVLVRGTDSSMFLSVGNDSYAYIDVSRYFEYDD